MSTTENNEMKRAKLTANQTAFFASTITVVIIEIAASYHASFNLSYSSASFISKFEEFSFGLLFLLLPVYLVFTRHRSSHAIIAGTLANMVLALIAGSVFCYLLVLKYDVSVSAFAFLVVPLYQSPVVAIMYLCTRKKA